MSVSDTRAVIGTSNRHIWVYDMRTLVEPEQRRVSSLKYQTRCLRVFPDQKGYAVGSVEGRVAVEYFDTSKVRGFGSVSGVGVDGRVGGYGRVRCDGGGGAVAVIAVLVLQPP